MNNFAYITYLCDEKYLPGIIALTNSLKIFKCNYPIILMITDNVNLENFKNINNVIIKKVEKIIYNGKNSILDRYKNNSWMMFTKLNIWKFVDYDKLVYLDADTIVLENIDNLFNNNELSAVLGGSEMLKYNGIEAGVLVVKPNMNMFNNLLSALNSDKYDLKMSDQSFINDYFIKNYKINYLPEKYNRLMKKNKIIKGAAIYHWNGEKPWNNNKIFNYNTWVKYYKINL